MSSGTRLLVVDDEAPIRRLLRTSLGPQGYAVAEAADATAALAAIAGEAPDIILLDLGLPDMDGLDLLRRIRAGSRVPVVVLSARGEEKAKVAALDLGADDYVTKPFGMAELVARLRTALRHRYQAAGAAPVFEDGDLKVDLVHRRVTVAGAEVHLSPKEYAILRLLVMHAGKVLTHRMLMEEAWGPRGDVQYLRIYVRQLRQKIEQDAERPVHILTETGVGYRLHVPD
ncbi:response regulator [Zavarzinia sp. CC-PAN008]|uniref:response regulator n=1 Tax=Zavarzinia sp. CC-PAN008 TaxID=3243332 RepID=UPI003F74316F